MLYVDSPIGTGFSFSNTKSDYTKWNDTMTVNENMKFILKWFEKFPKYRNSDFYLAGDGSPGHLIPRLASLVLEYNKNNGMPIKLKGIALGNPGSGIPGTDSAGYLWYHGVISQELHTMLKTVCSYEKLFYEGHHGNYTKDCQIVSHVMDEEMGEDFDMDDLISPKCAPSSLGSENAIGYPCLSENTFAYLNKQDVQKAFHVKRTPLPYHWDTCHGPVKFKEDAYTTKNFHTLATLLKRHIPIMFYSGDQDASIPVVETRTFARMLVKHLKLDYLQKNRPWHNGLQVGGWRETFGKLREKNNVTYLTFASVKGGSHFVPTTSPSQALTL
ncbi:unnamed protein product [Cuscuta europaea]|uniref:Uncharacterized protein n=1 Tax=Cuscuta europaea TaxID=41803 RepID=A0A9P1E193_CUSEU|nr:unnamed protein product [Cuscuta europaea]